MTRAPLLIEIGCEEIPARMIRAAAANLGAALTQILDRAGLDHGPAQAWGGSRRLAVRVADVQAGQDDRDELVLGPAAAAAVAPDGTLRPAGAGFARKHGVEPAALAIHETERGRYVGFRRQVPGRDIAAVLDAELQAAVESMSFPKTMRWGDGTRRWVRPVHWLVALHGERLLPLTALGVRAGRASAGHRFLAAGPVELVRADDYGATLAGAHVLVDPVERRERLVRALTAAADAAGGTLVEDPELLDEVADLVEWPGAVRGSFDAAYLDLPREILATTLRHHQKCFCVQDGAGRLLPAFVAVANTDRDPAGHVRRGNEWVIRGRLDDAQFFWNEDRKLPLAGRQPALGDIVYLGRLGSYAEKAGRMADLARSLARAVGLAPDAVAACESAARLCKCDLVTGLVGEFPELQGRVGGLLLAAEGASEPVARGVYEHYQPAGPEEPVPPSAVGAVVSIADKLDQIAGLIDVGETPSGSRDPFGLRRATAGVFRIVIERGWPLALRDLTALVGRPVERLEAFLAERLRQHVRELGYSANECGAVLGGRRDGEAASAALPDIVARLEAMGAVRERADFARLVQLTKRVDNILTKQQGSAADAEGQPFVETVAAARELAALVQRQAARLDAARAGGRYGDVVALLAEFVDPVSRFFEEVLVIDPAHPAATRARLELLDRLRQVVLGTFDLRELAGQAERRGE